MKVKFKGFENYALVTGAASGMGRLYTQRLALMGYNIVAVDINAESLAQTRDIVEKLVGSSLPEYVGNFRFIDIVQDLSPRASFRVLPRDAARCPSQDGLRSSGSRRMSSVSAISQLSLSGPCGCVGFTLWRSVSGGRRPDSMPFPRPLHIVRGVAPLCCELVSCPVSGRKSFPFRRQDGDKVDSMPPNWNL